MADDKGHDCASGECGTSITFPQQCSALRINGNVILKGWPCKIVEMSTSKTGKDGHSEVHLVGMDLFTGKKIEDICPSTHIMDVPHVNHTDYQLAGIVDGYMSLMGDNGGTIKDLACPENDIGKEIMAKFTDGDGDVMVTVLNAMGDEMVIAMKPNY